MGAFTGGGIGLHNARWVRHGGSEMGQSQKEIVPASRLEEEFTDFFEQGPTLAVTDPAKEVVADPVQSGVTLEESARLLNLHVDTIKKRLRKGTLKGFKVQEKFGEKWFVSSEELRGRAQVVTDPTQVVPSPGPKAVADDPPTPESAQVVSVTVSDSEQIAPLERLVTSLERKDLVIENQAHQLKAAGDVIMYLRSQIEEKETQLKLLTDSQHKRGWWTSFCSWFLGQKEN
jgi:exonuclease VII small subunit